MDINRLAKMALAARKKAYAPYSSFFVGAALLSADGEIYTGCNVENASYPVTCCAERTALYKAISDGARNFTAIAVAGGGKDESIPLAEYVMPCGMCRQALAEFGLNIKIISVRSETDCTEHTLTNLLPSPFPAP